MFLRLLRIRIARTERQNCTIGRARIEGFAYLAQTIFIAYSNCTMFELDIVIWEMISAYFRKTDAGRDFPTWITFDEAHEDDPMLYYGFPELDWGTDGPVVKVAANYPTRIRKKNERTFGEVHDVFVGAARVDMPPRKV